MTRITALFPLWALLASALAYLRPEWFTAAKPAIVPLLGIVMLGMGMSLRIVDFTDVLRRPGVLALGVGLQYGVMPVAAWIIGSSLGLAPALLTGLVLVGASPGGTASNLICYLARGDLALSISLTTISTLLAVILTPALTWLLVGERVPVPAGEMLWSIARIVLLPVALGVALNRLLGPRLAWVQRAFPVVSMAAICVIIAIIVALNGSRLADIGALVAVAVVLHNVTGLAAGYWISRWLGQDRVRARTLAIEVGMQNSGLAVALAVKFFSPVAALPGALFSIWHNLSGAMLAAWWLRGENTQSRIATNKAAE